MIPFWIKNNAAWWADGQLDDETFIQGLEFLIQDGISWDSKVSCWV